MPKYGPYHRVNSTSQTDEDAAKIEASGELWGRPPRGSGIPQPQAYDGPLPPGRIGIEFRTDVAPHGGSPPGQVRWVPGDPGVVSVDDDYAKIAIVVTKNTHPRPKT